MDDFTYQYTTGMNRLNYVTDAASAADATYTDDINSGQTTGNYVYDDLGQLTQDSQEGMRLKWRLGNKKLLYQENATTHVDYIYNPLGQRIVKIRKTMTSGIPTGQSSTYSWTYTYYAYDANGQVMSTYTVTMNNAATFKNVANVDEQMIYGGERIGLRQEAIRLYRDAYSTLIGPKYSNQLGYKNYELTNHLGNVNAAITDRKVLDPDYVAGVWYDFTSSTPTWTTFSGTPSLSVSGGNLLFGTNTGIAASAYRSETTAASQSYTFSLDIVDRAAVSNFSIELYKNSSNSLTGAALLKTFASSELVNGTSIHYSYTTAASGDNYFLYKLVKTSTETAKVNVDNLKFGKAVSRYKAVVVMKADYYPFGMIMPGRTYNNGNYRYGYNGMEFDPELKGNGNSYTTEFRQYDPRLGRWLSLDPLMSGFSDKSPYCGFDNNPIFYNDPKGLVADNPFFRKLANFCAKTAKSIERSMKAFTSKNSKSTDKSMSSRRTGENEYELGEIVLTYHVRLAVKIYRGFSRLWENFEQFEKKYLKGKSKYRDEWGTGRSTDDLGLIKGGNDWRTRAEDEYSDDDFKPFSSPNARPENLEYLPGSMNGPSRQKSMYGTKPGNLHKTIEVLDKVNENTFSKAHEYAKQSQEFNERKNKTPTSTNIELRVRQQNGTSVTCVLVSFATKQQMQKAYPDAIWNSEEGYWVTQKVH